MQIVIEIDESLLDGIKSDDFDFARRVVKNFQGTIASAIANGTPLPKGHGRLGDLDIFKTKLEKYWNERKGICYADIESIVDLLVPTILRADKE